MEKWGWWESATSELLEVLSLKEKCLKSSRSVNWVRLVFMAENTDVWWSPDTVTDFMWGHEDNWLERKLYFVLVHKVKTYLALFCVIFYCFRLPWRAKTTGLLSQLRFFPMIFLVCLCRRWPFSTQKPHVWICILAQFCRWYIWAVDWWFLKSSFRWWDLKVFSIDHSSNVVCFLLDFVFHAM